MVGYHPHRVYGFQGPASADYDRPPRKVTLPAQGVRDVAQQLLGFQEPAHPYQPGSQPSGSRAGDDDAPLAKFGQILLGGRVVVHVGIHGRSDQDRRPRRDHRGGQRVVGQARRQLGDAVHRGRGDDHDVGTLGQGYMLVGELRAGVKSVGDDLAMGDAAEGQGRHELGGPETHDRVHQRPGLHQLTGQVQGLVAGDAARDPEDDVFVS